MKYIFFLLILSFFTSCQEGEKEVSPQEKQKIRKIIRKTIEKAGGEKYKNATIVFKFRNHIYKSRRGRGEFHLERTMTSAADTITDVVSNTGFERYVNDSLIQVPDSLLVTNSSEVSTVHYFAHLPYGLNARALSKNLVGKAEIKGEPYFQLKMTFQQDSRGANHDEFMFWIHRENYTLDYLAYKFSEHEGGIRFRAAYDPKVIKGISFTNYKNYTIDDFTTDLKELDELYEAGKLEMISMIKTEVLNVEVNN